jgi:tetrahydromethanopterin S-methyltransferase subunit B
MTRVLVVGGEISRAVAAVLAKENVDVVTGDMLEVEPENCMRIEMRHHEYLKAEQPTIPSFRDFDTNEPWRKKQKRWRSK